MTWWAVPAQAQPPALPNSFTVDIGADIFAPTFTAPSYHGSCTLTRTGNTWSGAYGGRTLTVGQLGGTYTMTMTEGGKIVHSNTVMDTPGGRLRWRLGVPGACVLITQR